MPAAQDHKRVFDGDQGPNTGGMGAYAPAPLMTSPLLAEVCRTVLQPAVDGLAAEGVPYVGVLYAGIMLTGSRYGADGFRYAADGYSTHVNLTGSDRSPLTGHRSPFSVLEFNCRFGDPETQVILPLLESDLVDVIEACLNGRLAGLDVHWRAGAAATVVAASEGYPGSYPKGREISRVTEAEALPGIAVFHAGTQLDETGRLLTDGGRVLAVTGIGHDLAAALSSAYGGIERIHFQGMHYRRDIGAKAIVG
jgi:phosphoribosylamine--glycine ligase